MLRSYSHQSWELYRLYKSCPLQSVGWFWPESWVKMAWRASSSEVWADTSFFSSSFRTMASMIWVRPVFCRSSISRVRLRKSSTSLKARISAWKSFKGTFCSTIDKLAHQRWVHEGYLQCRHHNTGVPTWIKDRNMYIFLVC